MFDTRGHYSLSNSSIESSSGWLILKRRICLWLGVEALDIGKFIMLEESGVIDYLWLCGTNLECYFCKEKKELWEGEKRASRRRKKYFEEKKLRIKKTPKKKETSKKKTEIDYLWLC